MKRAPIDKAILVMHDRQNAVLRDVARSGGRDNFDHLSSHGHHHATIRRCIRIGYLSEPKRQVYELTGDGRNACEK